MDAKTSNSGETKDEFIVIERPINYAGLLPVFLLIIVAIARISYEVYKRNRQKTRNPQQRRMYVGSRARPSLSQTEPTIYVSPANLPPPPKYECLAPPSYEEVVGIHYPNYQVTQIQPITQPIVTAIAQSSSAENNVTSTESSTRNNEAPVTVITVTDADRRTSVTVATSSS